MKLKTILSLLGVCALSLGSVAQIQSNLQPSHYQAQSSVLTPSAAPIVASQVAYQVLSYLSYGQIGQTSSVQVYDEFLKSLDPQRVFLTQQEIDHFDQYKFTFIDYISEGELQIPYELFAIYRDSVEKRYNYAISLLDKDFDFSKNEIVELDRKKAAWPKDEAEIRELWRKRVKNDFLRLKLANMDDAKIRDILKRRYTSSRNNLIRFDVEDVGELIINAYTQSIDPHAAYFSPKSAKNFNIQMSLSVEGIGAVIQKHDEYAQIRELVAGGPAAKTGQIQPGDLIVAVAQGDTGAFEEVIDYRLDDVVSRIRGARGSVVRLELIPADGGADAEHKIVRIVRDKVAFEDKAARSKILEISRGKQTVKVGVIIIPSFYSGAFSKDGVQTNSVSKDVANILQNFQKEGVASVVIDLRSNGGGSLHEAAAVSGLFVGPSKLITQVGGSANTIDRVKSPDSLPIVWDKPVVVAVNKLSASASEIVAAVIQDYGRGVVVGDTTWGKGTVQTLREIAFFTPKHIPKGDYGEIKWTIQKFFRVNGGATQLKGVTPDIVFPSNIASKDLGESSYDNAVAWTKIAPDSQYHKPVKMPKLIKKLMKLHKERVNHSASWRLMLDQSKYLKSLQDRTYLSLNFKVRKDEREKQAQIRNDFEKVRKALGESTVETFSLDDGLLRGEGNLKQELEEEKKRRDNLDTVIRESAQIAADLVVIK